MISEQTRNKLTTIAENEQKVYVNGVADGKRAEDLKTWERLTGNGTRKNYVRVFEESDYSGYTFAKPIAPTEVVSQCFQNYIGTELPKNLDFTNIKFDTNKRIANLCYGAKNLKEFPDINMPAPPSDYWYSFRECKSLEKIEVLRCVETTQFTGVFSPGVNALKEIRIEGTIGQNFSIGNSPLSVASLKSIVKHLKSYLGTSSEYAYTLTVKTSAWEALVSAGCTDEDFAWIEETFGISKSLWEEFGFTWTDIVGYLRWNLVLA